MDLEVGDVLKVRKYVDDNWAEAYSFRSKEEGVCPRNHFEMLSQLEALDFESALAKSEALDAENERSNQPSLSDQNIHRAAVLETKTVSLNLNDSSHSQKRCYTKDDFGPVRSKKLDKELEKNISSLNLSNCRKSSQSPPPLLNKNKNLIEDFDPLTDTNMNIKEADTHSLDAHNIQTQSRYQNTQSIISEKGASKSIKKPVLPTRPSKEERLNSLSFRGNVAASRPVGKHKALVRQAATRDTPGSMDIQEVTLRTDAITGVTDSTSVDTMTGSTSSTSVDTIADVTDSTTISSYSIVDTTVAMPIVSKETNQIRSSDRKEDKSEVSKKTQPVSLDLKSNSIYLVERSSAQLTSDKKSQSMDFPDDVEKKNSIIQSRSIGELTRISF